MITQVKNQFRRLLPKNAFARGVSVLVGGTASAQLLLVLAAPLLTRLYSPEDFGLLAVYASLLALIGVISSMRYELAIPLPEDDGEAANIAVLCLILVVISTILTGVLVLLMGSAIAAALGVPTLAGYLWLLPVGVLLTGFYSVFNYWAVRTKRFTTIAGTKLRQAVATLAIQLAAFKLGGIALLLGQVAGQGVGTTTLGIPALKSAGFKQVSWAGVKKAAGRYKRFPIFGTSASFLNISGTQLPPVVFAALFGASAAGLYSIANRILTLPMSLVGQAISQVFLSHGSAKNREGALGRQVDKVLSILIQVAMPPLIFLVAFGPAIFEFVFGSEWRVAGEFARWMAPWLFIQFCMSPLTVFIILERQDLSLLMQISLFTLRAFAVVLGYVANDLMTMLIYFSMASALGYAIFLGVKISVSGASINKAITTILGYMLLTIAFTVPLALSFLLTQKVFILGGFVVLYLIFLGFYYYRLGVNFR